MGAADSPNNNEGWGRILLDNVLYFDGDTRELHRRRVDGSGDGRGHCLLLRDRFRHRAAVEITLVWTDYPAVASANPSLVNNLDLTVTSPTGEIYKGNVYSGGQSAGGGSYDARNVEECVRRVTPPTGPWTIAVRGTNVPQGGRQPYALVATGSFGAWPEPPAAVADGLPSGRVVLDPARPNPFSDETAISFRLPAEGRARVGIHDPSGRRVATLLDRIVPAGEHRIVWTGMTATGPAGSGVYFYRLDAAGTSITRKMTRIR